MPNLNGFAPSFACCSGPIYSALRAYSCGSISGLRPEAESNGSCNEGPPFENPDGVAVPRVDQPVADLSENVVLSTAFADYAWVNARQIWGVGSANLAEGKIHIDGCMQ